MVIKLACLVETHWDLRGLCFRYFHAFLILFQWLHSTRINVQGSLTYGKSNFPGYFPKASIHPEWFPRLFNLWKGLSCTISSSHKSRFVQIYLTVPSSWPCCFCLVSAGKLPMSCAEIIPSCNESCINLIGRPIIIGFLVAYLAQHYLLLCSPAFTG